MKRLCLFCSIACLSVGFAVPTRCWSQDHWQAIQKYFSTPEEFQNDWGSFRSTLEFEDGRRVKSAKEWQQRRREIRSQWTQDLGRWPPLFKTQKLQILETEKRDGFSLATVRFKWTPREWTKGYLTIPTGKGPFPAVITVYYEPETAIGKGKEHRDFALQLARRGFVTLSLGTTQATRNRTYALYHPSLQEAQVQPLSMLACAAANAWHALANHVAVDEKRIGIVGHSFGGKWAMFASCLFDEFACAVWSDPGIVFDTRPSVNYWEPWYLGYHPQPWRKRGLVTKENPAKGLYPKLLEQKRDLHELHVLMAPRPFLVSGGSEDPPARWRALNHSVQVNKLLGFEQRVGMTNRTEHSPNADSNEVVYHFFEHFLKSH